jgi:hypothetical protein
MAHTDERNMLGQCATVSDTDAGNMQFDGKWLVTGDSRGFHST